MSKYTTTIRQLIDNNFDFQLDEYPIFDEEYRPVLNQKILDHYYENEIGFETAALFRKFLKTKMNEIMPKYNILYTQDGLYDAILGNVDLKETMDRQSASEAKTEGLSKNKNLFQDTPQGSLSHVDIDEQRYATNLTQDKAEASNTASGASTEAYLKHIFGNNGKDLKIDVLNKFRNSIISIDMMIVDELQELFMGIM